VRVAVRIFAGTGAFGFVVGGIYWFVSSEAAGTTLLLTMGIAPLVLAVYVQRQRSRLRGTEPSPEDRPDATPQDAAGEVVGSFPTESVWPISLAGASVLVLGGLVYGPALLVLGLLGFAVAVGGLMRESRS
jgi:cytochrome c oxidase subunit IV